MLSKYIKKPLLITLLAISLIGLVGCGGGGGSAGEQSDTALLNENNNNKNTPPVAYDLNISTKENTLVEFTLNAKDKDKDKITYKILTKPKHGTLSGKAPKLTYTPKSNFSGNDSFTYIANDSKANSNEAVVNINVTPLKHTNKTPVAIDDNATTNEDTNVTIDILANDEDSDGEIDTNSIKLIKAPTHGVAKIVNAKVVYTPSLNYSGEDSFTYTVKDNEGALSNVAEVKITINPTNDAPVAYDENLTTKEDNNLTIILKGSDEDNDTLKYTIATKPKHGTLSVEAPNITYTPNANFNGKDKFTFKVNDGKVDSNEATVYINVEPVNDAPVAVAGEDVTVIRGDMVHFDGSKSYDIDGNISSYRWIDGNTTLSTDKIFEQKMLIEGVHKIKLIVTDDKNAVGYDEKVLTVKPCCKGCEYPDPTQTNPFK